MNWKLHSFSSVITQEQVDSIGHMNNVAYFQLFEDARWDMIIQHDYGADTMEKTQQGPVILSIDAQFKKEVMLRDRVVVESRTQSYEGKVLKLLQELRSEQGEIHCSALYTVGLFDMQARRLILPTPAWLHACGHLAD